MSDTCPTAFHSFLKWKLGVQSPSLAYAAKDMARTVLFAVNIPYPLLKAWHGILVKSGTTFSESSRDNNLDNNSINIEQCPFVDLFEYAIPGNSFAISPDNTIRSRINKGISTLAVRVSGEYAKLKGRKREELDSNSKLFHIYTGETFSVADIKKENSNMRDELQEWKKICKDLQNDIHTLYEEIGLEMESIKVSETETGNKHNIKFEECKDTNVSHNCHGFDALSDDKKSRVEKILFPLDKFCVGDCFYHELTMMWGDLPRSYLVKQKRDQLNKLCHITLLQVNTHFYSR